VTNILLPIGGILRCDAREGGQQPTWSVRRSGIWPRGKDASLSRIALRASMRLAMLPRRRPAAAASTPNSEQFEIAE
jgi:hypothetical protein